MRVPAFALVTLVFSVFAFAAAGCGGEPEAAASGPCNFGAKSGAPKGTTTIPRFRHVVVIVLENHSFGEIIGASGAPNFNRLARQYALLTSYCAVTHPSLPNYLALVSGSAQGLSDNCDSCSFSAQNLADTLQQAHKSWKDYDEGLPAPGYKGGDTGRYEKHHNPFVYFTDIRSRPERLRHVVPLGDFQRDLAARRLPDLSFVVPAECHNLTDCPLRKGDTWLAGFLRPLLTSPALGSSVVFVVFDEGNKDDPAGGGGHIPVLVLGPTVRPHSRSGQALSHYDLLRTIEDAWRLRRLGRSVSAQPIRGIWR